MLKNERLEFIVKTVNQRGTVSLRELEDELKVTRMTLQRDVNELAQDSQLIRIRGGAQSIHQQQVREISRHNKTALNLPAKRAIAKTAASRIHSGSTIYVGPGTTLERLSEFLAVKDIRIVTSSLPVFNVFRNLDMTNDLVMIGGTYRPLSGAFVGSIANEMIEKLNFQIAFIGLNGLSDGRMMTANAAEGEFQRLALEHAQQKIILADATKFEKNDFYTFYELNKINELITDNSLSKSLQKKYSQLSHLTIAPNP
ncbi:DeoR/GlpR family DNA-binding transcription regulator [Loigolactobacillus coryniformis]|uniref:DeoR/GlpR family DNA-binding transcription regulator n=1 Tax=Loigolactobacillus coryniformis TaxID=1610 RepID=UPI001C5F549F|nr:DeoR/GlpR family DNA-binding transcription regulator [Loigolactobacillus coryniformis]MBW4803844.1 DeoR/GlpR transcriptional regulator [Loigolactobacillus coryniformis subsp. torquens]MBW4806440.1 DeoR/GlpR transcriptional regulator [Loigolactobacillus coryniformis subsp. torquens]